MTRTISKSQLLSRSCLVTSARHFAARERRQDRGSESGHHGKGDKSLEKTRTEGKKNKKNEM